MHQNEEQKQTLAISRADSISKAIDIIKEANGVIVLTGAGISTDSGIPDFRSPKTGLWEKTDPMATLAAPIMKDYPETFYEHYIEFHNMAAGKSPNRGHYALASLEKKGIVKAIVTQNIDGLHQEAGSEKVYEAHGTTATFRCMRCGQRFPSNPIMDSVKNGVIPPTCPLEDCDGIVRPDVVLFGDMLPDWYYTDVPKLVRQNDLLIAIGTSLTVYPVAQMAEDCRRLIIINREPTPFDGASTLVINDEISDVLEALDKAF